MRNVRLTRLSMALLVVMTGLVAVGLAVGHSPQVGVQPDGSVIVPTVQALTPAGDHVAVSDRPLGMVVNPAGNLLAVVTGSNFPPRSLHLIDVNSKTITQTISIGSSFVGVDFPLPGIASPSEAARTTTSRFSSSRPTGRSSLTPRSAFPVPHRVASR
jgi:hypothetical protein